MKCNHCSHDIAFLDFFVEMLNPLKFGYHTCKTCGKRYKVNLHLVVVVVIVVVLQRCFKLLWYDYYKYYHMEQIIYVNVCGIIVIYILCIIQQLIFWHKSKK